MKIYTKFKIPLTNMFIIRWYPNCITPIHGHTGLDCNFLVLR